MSKILDALRLSPGEIPELALRSLGGECKNPEPGRAATGTADGPPADAPQAGRLRTASLPLSDAKPLLAHGSRSRNAAEQYRILRTRIIQHPNAPALIVISSPGAGEGKTVTAVNLAGALALKSQEKVLLLDADLRRSRMHEYLGVPRTPGLAEVLAGACPLQKALLQVEQAPNFYLLPAGEPSTNPAELFDSPRWPALAEHSRRQFGHVIIDCPPVEAVADYDLIAAACDGVILVVRPDYTGRKACAGALNRLGENLLGVLLNGVREPFFRRRSSEYACAPMRGAGK